MTRSHVVAALQALFVTFLWSTSWVLIKIGLQDIPALTFAGLRYSLAFLILLPFALRRVELRTLSRVQWRDLALLGLVFYAVTQGAQFLALAYLSAQTASLLLSFSPVAVALLAGWTLDERMTLRRWAGVALYGLGALLYFLPVGLQQGPAIGFAVILVAVLANAAASVLGRAVNRSGRLSPLTVTVASMGVGSLALLAAGVSVQGLPPLSPTNWGIIAWLALVNTALAFTLWNHTLRTLTALESSILNNTMLIQIAVLAWMFLDEQLTAREIAAFGLATLGTLTVQLRGARPLGPRPLGPRPDGRRRD